MPPPSCSGRRMARRDPLRHEINYGKADVKVYRTHAEPLTGITPIPESPFTGRDNTLTAAEIEVVVRGDGLPGRLHQGRQPPGGRHRHDEELHPRRLAARSVPGRWRSGCSRWVPPSSTPTRTWSASRCSAASFRSPPRSFPPRDGDGFEASDRLFSRDRCDHGSARLDLARHDDGSVHITDHESGRRDLQLIKITGSAFADFARDEHTTLPERPDRPLYIWCDIGWRYADASHAVLADPARYVASEQVADLAVAVFHEFVSLSIQHLVNEIGERMLDSVAAAGGGQLRRPEPALGPRRRIERGLAGEDLQRSPPAVRPHRARPAPRLTISRRISTRSLGSVRPGISFDAVSPMRIRRPLRS